MSSKFIKTVLSLVLAISLVAALPFGVAAGALDNGRSGACGDNLKWKLDKKGLLTISGTGEMNDYDDEDSPWLLFNESITKAVIEKGVTHIGNNAFFNCDSLADITLPETLTSIGDGAFSSCSALSSVTLGEALKTIGEGAFSHCRGLTEFNIPAKLESIGDKNFEGCVNLEKITVAEENTKYSSIDGVLFNKGATELIRCPQMKQGVYKVPATVTSVNDGAFGSCSELTFIMLPHSLRMIGDGAISWCKKLTSVFVPNSVMSIGKDTFTYCGNLKVLGYKGSAMEEYALNNKVAFEVMASTADCKSVAFYKDGRNIAEDAELIITSDDNTVAPEAIAGADIYNISLRKNDKSVFLLAPMIICMPIENEIQPLPGSTVGYEVYRITDSGKAKKADSSVEGRYIVFAASSEGRYAILPVIISEDGTSHSAVETKIMTGDVNGDKNITLEDVVAIQRHMAELEKLGSVQKYNADADKDGYVSMNDVVMIQRQIAKLISF